MPRNNFFRVAVIIFLTVAACAPREQKTSQVLADIPVCGTVQFSDGCSEELDPMIAYGLALVHHMTYEEADVIFTKVVEADENCFWGPWGKALSYIHPLWNDPPSQERMAAGLDLSQKAMKLASTEKEFAYGRAVAAYFESGSTKSDKERLKSFHDGWALASKANPEDLEAKAFYALSLIAISDPTDKTFANQMKAGRMAEEVLTKIADHPGGISLYHSRV